MRYGAQRVASLGLRGTPALTHSTDTRALEPASEPHAEHDVRMSRKAAARGPQSKTLGSRIAACSVTRACATVSLACLADGGLHHSRFRLGAQLLGLAGVQRGQELGQRQVACAAVRVARAEYLLQLLRACRDASARGRAHVLRAWGASGAPSRGAGGHSAGRGSASPLRRSPCRCRPCRSSGTPPHYTACAARILRSVP